MRISSDPSDFDYWKFYFEDVDILLNGSPQRYVLEADTDYGYIVQRRMDPDGRLILEGVELPRDVVYGYVKLEGCRRNVRRYRTRHDAPSIDTLELIALEAGACRRAIARVGYIGGE